MSAELLTEHVGSTLGPTSPRGRPGAAPHPEISLRHGRPGVGLGRLLESDLRCSGSVRAPHTNTVVLPCWHCCGAGLLLTSTTLVLVVCGYGTSTVVVLVWYHTSTAPTQHRCHTNSACKQCTCISQVQHWRCTGAAVLVTGRCSSAPMILTSCGAGTTLAMPWNYTGAALVVSWCYTHAALVLSAYCAGTLLAQYWDQPKYSKTAAQVQCEHVAVAELAE